MGTMRVLMYDFSLEFDCVALKQPVAYTRNQPSRDRKSKILRGRLPISTTIFYIGHGA